MKPSVVDSGEIPDLRIVGNKNSDPNKDEEKIRGASLSNRLGLLLTLDKQLSTRAIYRFSKPTYEPHDHSASRSKGTQTGSRPVRCGFEKG
jgi:hypothetical protein